jgi:uncharacterized protein (UPF0261 family)
VALDIPVENYETDVYSAGENRLKAASAAGLPQVIVPGAIDHSNFWVNMVPEKFSDREFFQYNAQNILMRTNALEYKKLGILMAERLNHAEKDFVVLVPLRGFSEHTKRNTHDLGGNIIGSWDRPDDDMVFLETLKQNLKRGEVEELDLHINDPAFANACLKSSTSPLLRFCFKVSRKTMSSSGRSHEPIILPPRSWVFLFVCSLKPRKGTRTTKSFSA